MKKHGRIILTIVFLVIFIAGNSLLSYVLIPPGLTRVMLHELEKDDYQCVILGTSHGSYGLDADKISQISGMRTMNLCIGGEYLQDSYFLLKKVLETGTPEMIIIDLDFQYLVNVPKQSVSANFIYNAYPFSSNKIAYFSEKIVDMEYRAAIFSWLDYRNNYYRAFNILKTKIGSEYINYSPDAVEMETCDSYRGNGFIYRNRENLAKTDSLMQVGWDAEKVDQESVEYFQKIVKICSEKNIRLMVTTLPVPEVTMQNSFEAYSAAYEYIDNLARANNVEYYNFNKIRQDYFEKSEDGYWDYDGHMYGDTAEKFSVIYAEVIAGVKNNNFNLSRYFVKEFE